MKSLFSVNTRIETCSVCYCLWPSSESVAIFFIIRIWAGLDVNCKFTGLLWITTVWQFNVMPQRQWDCNGVTLLQTASNFLSFLRARGGAVKGVAWITQKLLFGLMCDLLLPPSRWHGDIKAMSCLFLLIPVHIKLPLFKIHTLQAPVCVQMWTFIKNKKNLHSRVGRGR